MAIGLNFNDDFDDFFPKKATDVFQDVKELSELELEKLEKLIEKMKMEKSRKIFSKMRNKKKTWKK